MLRSISQKKKINHIRRLLVNMAIGAAVGVVIRWVRGVEVAPLLCALTCGAAVLLKINKEDH